MVCGDEKGGGYGQDCEYGWEGVEWMRVDGAGREMQRCEIVRVGARERRDSSSMLNMTQTDHRLYSPDFCPLTFFKDA